MQMNEFIHQMKPTDWKVLTIGDGASSLSSTIENELSRRSRALF